MKVHDPIFAAIERHRTALAAYEAVPEAMEEGYEAVAEAQSDAYAALLAMQPTTKAGAHAALEYLIALNWDEGLEQFAETVRASQVFATAGLHLEWGVAGMSKDDITNSCPVAALADDAVSTDDPVLIAIARYKKIEARVDYRKSRKKYEHEFSWPVAIAELTDAARAVFVVEPTTPTSALALLRFVAGHMAAFSLVVEANNSIRRAVAVLEVGARA